jgi:hypothetical protein
LPFQNYFKDILEKSTQIGLDRNWWYYEIKGYDIGFIVINTAYNFTFKKSEINITSAYIKEIKDNIKNIKKINILVCHHPISMWGNDDYKEEILKILYNRLNIRIILSGHKHSNKIRPHRVGNRQKIVEIQTGSILLENENNNFFDSKNFRIIHVKLNHKDNTGIVRACNFIYNKGIFVPFSNEKGGALFEEEEIFI